MLPTTSDDQGHGHAPFWRCAAQLGEHIVDGEARRVGVGEHARDERAQPAVVLARRVGLRRRGADERADAALGLDHAGAFELRVDPGDGVGVDLEVDGQLADGRQLVAGPQAAGGDRRAQPAFELRVDRRADRVGSMETMFIVLVYYDDSVLVQLVSSAAGAPRGRPAAKFVAPRTNPSLEGDREAPAASFDSHMGVRFWPRSCRRLAVIDSADSTCARIEIRSRFRPRPCAHTGLILAFTLLAARPQIPEVSGKVR